MEHQDLVDKNEESVQSIEKVSNTEDRDKMNEVEGVKSELINVDESKDRFHKMCRFTNCFLKSEVVDFLSEGQYLESPEVWI